MLAAFFFLPVLGGLLLMLGLFGAVSHWFHYLAASGEISYSAGGPPPPLPYPKRYASSPKWPGAFAPRRDRNAGRVASLHVRAGDQVAARQPLVEVTA